MYDEYHSKELSALYYRKIFGNMVIYLYIDKILYKGEGMDKNCYIENVLNLSNLHYVIWSKDVDDKYDNGIPARIYSFIELFYQELNYSSILHENGILQMKSELGVCYLLIPGDEQIYVMGPYLPEKSSITEFYSTLINNNLPIEYETNIFYNSLPVISETKIGVLQNLFQIGIGITGYRTIQQKHCFPKQEHMHNQFFIWKNAEAAYNSMIQADMKLFQSFLEKKPNVMENAIENYILSVSSIKNEFDPGFLQENLRIANGLYHHFCIINTQQFNEISSIYYQFHSEILNIRTLNDAIKLHCFMYKTYHSAMFSYEYQKYPYLVQQVLLYVNNHWREKITLKDIADTLSINKCYLSSLFNESVGMKITDYIHKTKIDWAEIFLKSTNIKIADIAYLCGYDDISYFGKIYKKQRGKTPTQTRENRIESKIE